LRQLRQAWRRGGAGGERQKVTASKRHGILPWTGALPRRLCFVGTTLAGLS
jgi:hypothetical protein